ncbi:MAG: HAD family hydrolase [Fervidobacterium sp.]|jgi:FMN phosphatase YigB (HAD superfamily)
MYIFLDYDGTIVETNEREFTKVYFDLLAKKLNMSFEEIFNIVMKSLDEAMASKDEAKSMYEKFLCSIVKIAGNSEDFWRNTFLDFYKNEFDELGRIAKPNVEILNLIRSTKKKLIFASNPVFPEIATIKRIKFVGIEPTNFVYIAHMENSRFAKPNKRFFSDILDKLNISPDQCVMIGDSNFDRASEEVGIKFIHVSDTAEWKNLFLD